MSSKMVKKISRVLAAPIAQRQHPKKNGGGKRRSKRKNLVRYSRVPRGILAGYGSPLTASFYQVRSRDGEIVRGFDLVTSPLVAGANATNISFFITANPAAWNGTRIAAIAAGYQNYRPLTFKIHYRPQVGSTSTISMFIGTVWQNTYITSRSALEPSLVTSPGGTYLPAWQSSCSVVPLGSRLPQRMFPIRDPDFTTVPFSVVCRASEGGPTSPSVPMPGRIFIEYAYEFRNAIGSGEGFAPSRILPTTLRRENLFHMQTGGQWSDSYSTIFTVNGNSQGWVVDFDGPPSTIFPLFAHLSMDSIEGGTVAADALSTARPTGMELISIPKINGAQVDAEMYERDVTLSIYTDNGLPD